MKVIVVDDEAPARERLAQLLCDLPDTELVDSASDGKTALQRVQQHQPDVVLLDIRMPGMDGLETARHLSRLPRPPAIIFTTAYSEHALEAFEVEAVDYLMKPVRRERLASALGRARRLSTSQLQGLNVSRESVRSHLMTRHHGNIHLIPVEEVILFQADQKYVTAYSTGGEALLEDSLKSLEEEFGGQFLRIHRSTLIATRAIVGMERDSRGGYQAVLEGSDRRPEISRRHVAEVRRYLKEKA